MAQEFPADARKALDKGVAAARQGQWTVALKEFDYALYYAAATPAILFNLALTNDRMGGREVPAIGWYRAYLAVAPDAANRDQVLARIAALEETARATGMKLLNAAMEGAQRLSGYERASRSVEIATSQAYLGDPAGAFSTIAQIPEDDSKYWWNGGYVALAGAFARVGDLANAETALRRILTPEKKDDGLHGIVTGLIERGQISAAQAYAAHIKGSGSRIGIYLSLAGGQLNAGDRAAARSSLDIAISEFNSLAPDKRGGYAGNLIAIADRLDEVALAQRILDSVRWTADQKKYSWPSAAYRMAGALIRANRLVEAEALISRISPDPNNFYRKSPTERIKEKQKEEIKKRKEELDGRVKRLIDLDKLGEAEAALTGAPHTEDFISIRSSVADAYRNIGDRGAAKRVLDAASVALTRELPPQDKAWIASILASGYRSNSDLASARRVLDAAATADTLATLQKADRTYMIERLVKGYAELANAEVKAGSLAAAKRTAAVTLKLAAANVGAARSGALYDLRENIGTLGIAAEVSRLLASVPPSETYRDDVLSALALVYASSRDIRKTAATVSQIASASTRKSARWYAIRPFVQAGDWQSALILANDPESPAELYAMIAKDMLAAGEWRRAEEIEPKFTASESDRNDYLHTLASRLAENGEFDRAVRAALRRSTLADRLDTLASVFHTTESLAGRAAARKVFDLYSAQLREISPADRTALCKSLAGSNRPSDISIAGMADGVTPLRSIAAACLADAQSIPDLKDRVNSWNTLLDRQGKSNRHLLAHWLAAAETASSPYGRKSLVDTGLALLNSGGATESFIVLARTTSKFPESYHLARAAEALAAAGDDAAARALLALQLAAAESKKSERDWLFSWALGVLLALGDVDGAAALVSKIASPGLQFSGLSSLAQAMAKKGRKQEAVSLIRKALEKSRLAGQVNRSDLGSLAALAVPLGEYALADAILAEIPSKDRSFGLGLVVRALLKEGQKERARTGILALETTALERRNVAAYEVNSVAGLWAWAGETGHVEKLVAATPQPVLAAHMLFSASDGFTRAGNAQAAQEALARGLRLLRIDRPDFAAWSTYKIAMAEAATDVDRAASRMRSIADPDWRMRGLVDLAQWQPAKRAMELVSTVPPTPRADQLLAGLVPRLVAEGAARDARTLIGRITDGALRDRARRSLVLQQARRGQVDDALADVRSVEEPAARAYLLADLGALFELRDDKARAHAANMAAAELAEQLSDPLIKADVLTTVAHNAARIGSDLAAPLKRKAIEAARSIAIQPLQAAAIHWVDGIDLADLSADRTRNDELAELAEKKLESDSREVHKKWGDYIRFSLKGDLFTNVAGFVSSVSSKNPEDVVRSLAEGAGQYGDAIRRLRDLSAEWEKAHAPQKN